MNKPSIRVRQQRLAAMVLAGGYFNAAGESAQAAWNLGQCGLRRQGVEQDVPKALEAWKKAAEIGHGRSASTAAMVYLAGEGIASDVAAARKLAEARRR